MSNVEIRGRQGAKAQQLCPNSSHSIIGEIELLTGPQLAEYVNERAAFSGTTPVYPDPSSVTHTNWQDAVTDDAGMQNANVSFSGGRFIYANSDGGLLYRANSTMATQIYS